MANIGLIGLGKMGQEIARLAEEQGHKIVATFDVENLLTDSTNVDSVDVFVEFTEPGAVIQNLKTVARRQRPLVIGTTGWLEHLPQVEQIVRDMQIGVIYAANFSIGMNLFFKIIENASFLFDKFAEYDPFIHEIHHKFKVDSPSGTALTLGKILLDNMKRKTEMQPRTSEGQISPTQLHVTSTRVGNVPGTHLVGFESEADSIELQHTARNRSGFALGALYAAEWIIGKKGLFTMDDLMRDLLDRT
ncbi:MAG: 4-hydroxy-tetrahydrodipicolinate reductase [bacterium]